MPRSRLESAVVLLGVAALALLVWLGVLGWHRYDSRRHGDSAPVTTTTMTTAVATLPATAAPPERRAAPAPSGRLTLTATRGNCWIVLRAGSAGGRQLYAGVLERSRSISFRGRRFWLSLGAAANVDARFGKQLLRGFPTGTATVAIDGAAARLLG